MMKRQTLTLTYVLFATLASHGQLITGKVVNTIEELPMHACVISSARQTLAFTDKDGSFSIHKTDSTHELVFHFVGMNSFSVNIGSLTKDTDLGTLFMFESPRFYYIKKGMATETYRNGQIRFFLTIKKSFAHGPYTEYYENGKLKIQGHYKKHTPTGGWTYYRMNGDTVKITFDNGCYLLR